MKIFNTDGTKINLSLINYDVINFSDSQKQIILNKDNYISKCVKIVTRMSWNDLQLIVLVIEALKRQSVVSIHLEVPYFLGARSDRLFDKFSTNYLKDIICPIINSLNLKSVSILDPHSSVLEACINNFEELSIKPFYDWFNETYLSTTEDKQQTWVVSPDYGAIKRVEKFANNYGFEKVLNCSKVREIQTGKILDIHIPITDFGGHNCIIIDDICDNGNTFINLAKELKERNAGTITLLVTHGIFASGFDNLFKYIDKIYTTNSIDDLNFLLKEKGFTSLFQYSVI